MNCHQDCQPHAIATYNYEALPRTSVFRAWAGFHGQHNHFSCRTRCWCRQDCSTQGLHLSLSVVAETQIKQVPASAEVRSSAWAAVPSEGHPPQKRLPARETCCAPGGLLASSLTSSAHPHTGVPLSGQVGIIVPRSLKSSCCCTDAHL
jgi:hypothetical protein